VSEITHKPELLFAVEDDPSHPDLSMGLADYRRLSANQRAAYAAELKRKVHMEIAGWRNREAICFRRETRTRVAKPGRGRNRVAIGGRNQVAIGFGGRQGAISLSMSLTTGRNPHI
jgi:hypothetical protein